MRIEPGEWRDTAPLRSRVLGWEAVPVSGDLDLATEHLLARAVDGRVLGGVSLCPHPCPERPGASAVYLWAMAVTTECQGHGIGRTLVDRVLARAAQLGAVVVWADARTAAIGFYCRCGAVAVGSRA